MTDIEYMKMALVEAQKAFDKDEVPIGAIVVCKGRIIARAHNLTEMLNDVTAHAEMQAITAAATNIGGKYLNDCTLYVTVEPCPMCAGAIINARIKTLIFGAYDSKMGSIDSVINLCDYPYNHKVEVYGGICEDEALAVLQNFFKDLRG